MQFGYKLASEEQSAPDLVRYARRAERAGFTFASISDHFHPWINQQGHSPFVWSVLGGIAQATEQLRVGTGVTCPTIRIHPAIIAQAAATTATMLPGRFFLGVGTGERLNEHILADHWPEAEVRLEMLEEAIDLIRLLWEGGQKSYRGEHYVVENARVYDLPDDPPPIYVAASGKRALQTAGRIGDGLVAVAPDPEAVQTFERAGGSGKPRLAECHVCYARDEEDAQKAAHAWWPIVGLAGELMQELATPAHFEQASQLVTQQSVAEVVACGPDPDKHIDNIQKFVDAGFDHIVVHQIGPDQDGFFDFYENEVLPKLG